MPAEVVQFRCPVCGQHAPLDRLDTGQPFVFQLFKKLLGGKVKLTDEQREARRGMGFARGSAPGALSYLDIPMADEARDLLIARLEESINQESD